MSTRTWGTPKYKIVRFYYPDCFKPRRTIKRGLTLEQAQAHCSDPNTRQEGKWFDGYEHETVKGR